MLSLILLISGCYTYAEVSPAAVPPGSNVRVRVHPQVRLSMGEVPLPDGGRVIRGKLLPGNSTDTLLFLVAPGSRDPLAPFRGFRGAVSVPVTDVERLEVRRLQKGRTAAVVATGTLLGLVVLDWAFNISNSSERPGENPGGVNNARFPFSRVR